MKLVTLPDGSSVEAFEHAMSLTIVSLRGSVPAQWVADFQQALGKYAGFTLDQRKQLADIYWELGSGKVDDNRSAGVSDCATVGDAWLALAVKDGKVQPMPGAQHARWWRHLGPRWRELVRRDAEGRPDPKGHIYAAPYRWGATLVVSMQDRLTGRGGWPVADWADLLQPQLEGRIAFHDSSRELVGVALKILGLGFNTTAAQLHSALGKGGEERLAQQVVALRRQAKLFSSQDHIRALEADDVWALVGWSQDVIGVAERSQKLKVVAPASGTALWADLWAVPSTARGGHQQQGPSPILPSWLEFGLMPARILTLPGLKGGASPLLLPEACAPSTPSGLGPHAAASAAGLASPAKHSRWHNAFGGRDTGAAHSSGDPAAGASASTPAACSSDASPEGAAAARSPFLLTGDNSYLPPASVLQHSEFLLPLDDDTLQLYRRVLEAR